MATITFTPHVLYTKSAIPLDTFWQALYFAIRNGNVEQSSRLALEILTCNSKHLHAQFTTFINILCDEIGYVNIRYLLELAAVISELTSANSGRTYGYWCDRSRDFCSLAAGMAAASGKTRIGVDMQYYLHTKSQWAPIEVSRISKSGKKVVTAVKTALCLGKDDPNTLFTPHAESLLGRVASLLLEIIKDEEDATQDQELALMRAVHCALQEETYLTLSKVDRTRRISKKAIIEKATAITHPYWFKNHDAYLAFTKVGTQLSGATTPHTCAILFCIIELCIASCVKTDKIQQLALLPFASLWLLCCAPHESELHHHQAFGGLYTAMLMMTRYSHLEPVDPQITLESLEAEHLTAVPWYQPLVLQGAIFTFDVKDSDALFGVRRSSAPFESRVHTLETVYGAKKGKFDMNRALASKGLFAVLDEEEVARCFVPEKDDPMIGTVDYSVYHLEHALGEQNPYIEHVNETICTFAMYMKQQETE